MKTAPGMQTSYFATICEGNQCNAVESVVEKYVSMLQVGARKYARTSNY